MSDPAFRFAVLRRALLFFGTAGLLVTVGCSNGPGGSAFRRFWGFEQEDSPGHLEQMLPPMLGQFSASSGGCEDPFLNQDFQSPAEPIQTAETTETSDWTAKPESAATMFESSPAPAGSPSKPKPDPTSSDGNPFRVVQHETVVNEISSANQPAAVDSAPPEDKDAPKATLRSSQLDRLKIALNRDAKTQLPPKPHIDGAEVARHRVEAIMKNARRQMQLGEYSSALRWAMAAEQLAERSELFFGPEEDPPADLVRSLQDRLQVPPQAFPPAGDAIAEKAVPMPVEENSASQPSEVLNKSPREETTEPEIPVSPQPPQELASAPHTTRAMQEAVIAPETLSPEPVPQPLDPPDVGRVEIAPGQKHARSLKVDARRVSANRGATVSVEGQLNPPVESPLPQLEMAPPASEANAEPPTGEVAMANAPPRETPAPPPLPPPSTVEKPPEPAFLYAEDEPPPAPKAVKNVRWEDIEIQPDSHPGGWWIFPLMGVVGGLLLGLLIFKRVRP